MFIFGLIQKREGLKSVMLNENEASFYMNMLTINVLRFFDCAQNDNTNSF